MPDAFFPVWQAPPTSLSDLPDLDTMKTQITHFASLQGYLAAKGCHRSCLDRCRVTGTSRSQRADFFDFAGRQIKPWYIQGFFELTVDSEKKINPWLPRLTPSQMDGWMGRYLVQRLWASCIWHVWCSKNIARLKVEMSFHWTYAVKKNTWEDVNPKIHWLAQDPWPVLKYKELR